MFSGIFFSGDKPEFPLWNEDLKPCTLSRFTSFSYRNSCISEYLTDQEKAQTSPLAIPEFKYLFFFMQGNTDAIVFIDKDQGFPGNPGIKPDFCELVPPCCNEFIIRL